MESNNKKIRITDGLKNQDLKTAKSAVKKIRKEGRIEDIPEIIEAYRTQENDSIRKEIHSLLCDVKLSGAQDFIIGGIKDPENVAIMDRLVSVCWESKQDFTSYLEVFIAIFLNGEYAASIEALTMIEKIFMDYEMPEDKLIQTINFIKTSYNDLTQNKKDLAFVLLDTLENLKA